MQDVCKNWNKAKNKAGYGVTWNNGKVAYAHRIAINAAPGEIVRHTCDNPSCVNPNHLIKGTAKENSDDMVVKNRQAKGNQIGVSKLDEDTVRLIRSAKQYMSSRQAAGRWNIAKSTVLAIWNNKIWKHIV